MANSSHVALSKDLLCGQSPESLVNGATVELVPAKQRLQSSEQLVPASMNVTPSGTQPAFWKAVY